MQKIYTFMKQYILSIEIFVVFVLIFVAVVFFHHVEWISLFDSMYYTVITLAGVGYWDIVPKSPEGKVIAIWLASIGMPLFLLASTIFATKIIEGMRYHHYKQKKTLISKVKACIIDQDKILLLKIDHNGDELRDLPGWTIGFWEKIKNALVRRVLQELHIHVQVQQSLGVRRRIDREYGTHSICHTYLAQVHDQEKHMYLQDLTHTDHGVITWVAVVDIIDGTIDIENDSLVEVLRWRYHQDTTSL